jgi:acyl-CoA thioester hydrolase
VSDRYRRDGGPPETAFSMVQRVRFGDLDAMQHMNNVEYLRFFETARIDYLMGILPEHNPGSRRQFGFIFAECHIAYRSPAHFGEEVRTFVWPTGLERSSIRLEFAMQSATDGRLLAEGYGVLVGYDYAAGASRPVPDELRQRLQPELVG